MFYKRQQKHTRMKCMMYILLLSWIWKLCVCLADSRNAVIYRVNGRTICLSIPCFFSFCWNEATAVVILLFYFYSVWYFVRYTSIQTSKTYVMCMCECLLNSKIFYYSVSNAIIHIGTAVLTTEIHATLTTGYICALCSLLFH